MSRQLCIFFFADDNLSYFGFQKGKIPRDVNIEFCTVTGSLTDDVAVIYSIINGGHVFFGKVGTPRLSTPSTSRCYLTRVRALYTAVVKPIRLLRTDKGK